MPYRLRASELPLAALRAPVLLLALALAPARAGAQVSSPVASPASAPMDGGRYAFRTFAEEDGLGNLTVECLLQDRSGFLWVGTQDGLFRFDGARFTRFGREEGLPSTRINCLHETADGRLYVGTRSGLARRVGEHFVAIGSHAGLPEASIPDEGIASDQTTVFVGMPSGLYTDAGSGNTDRFHRDGRDDGAAEEPVTGLHVNAAGELFFARRGRLWQRTAGRSREIGVAGGLPNGEPIDETTTDRAGTLWVRTLTTLYGRSVGGERFVDASGDLPAGVSAGRIALDAAGALMIPTQRGLARASASGWSLLGRSRGLESDTVLSALVDREGSLWIGLAGVGLAQQLGSGAFSSWGTSEGLPHDVVWSIVRQKTGGVGTQAGSLWVGTQEGLARIEADGKVRSYRQTDGLAGNTVYALAAADDGSVWAGSWPGGVTRFGPERERIRRYSADGVAPSEFRVASLHVAPDGVVWAGARSGLYRLDPRSGRGEFERAAGISAPDPDTVYAIESDPAGNIFAAGRFGLQVLGPAAGPSGLRRFRKADGLRADFLGCLVREPDGSLIVGYREALGAERISLDRGRFTARPLNRQNGLTSDKVIFVGHDARGRLWIGSGSGVDVLADGAAREGGSGSPTAHSGRSSGLISEDMSQNAFFAEPDGTVWLGTSRGLVRFRSGLESVASPAPPVVLTDFEAGHRRLDPTRFARLSHQDRHVRIAWAGLTFLDPKKVRFRYRLSGLDEAFTETSSTEVNFPALPTGQYRFEVAAISAAGRQSEKPATLSIEIEPAWWQRIWARAGALALVLLAAAGAVSLRTRSLEADRRRLEAAVAERSAELAAANRELEVASTTDPLTHLRNRRYFSMVIDEDVRRACRAHHASASTPAGQRDLVFSILDLDHFKSINDLYGHDAGDRVLIEVAERLRQVARQSDLLIRWGGEEFLVMSRDSDRTEASVLARRILEALANGPFDVGEGRAVRLTGSVGWAPFPWDPARPEAHSFEEVLRVADRALYDAKERGRNQSVGAIAVDPQEPGARLSGELAFRFEATPGP